jgi:hypothetical protein
MRGNFLTSWGTVGFVKKILLLGISLVSSLVSLDRGLWTKHKKWLIPNVTHHRQNTAGPMYCCCRSAVLSISRHHIKANHCRHVCNYQRTNDAPSVLCFCLNGLSKWQISLAKWPWFVTQRRTYHTYEQSHELMQFLLTPVTSRQMFRRLMSPSSGDTHCEERRTSIWFVTGVWTKTVHIDTFGSAGSREAIVVNKKCVSWWRRSYIKNARCQQYRIHIIRSF